MQLQHQISKNEIAQLIPNDLSLGIFVYLKEKDLIYFGPAPYFQVFLFSACPMKSSISNMAPLRSIVTEQDKKNYSLNEQ
jgi:hypothetical protein